MGGRAESQRDIENAPFQGRWKAIHESVFNTTQTGHGVTSLAAMVLLEVAYTVSELVDLDA